MAQHHALRLAGGAGGVENRGRVQGRRAADFAVAGVGTAFRLDETQVAYGYDELEASYRLLAQLGQLFLGDEDSLGFGVDEDVLHLAGGEFRQHRYGNAPVDRDREECRAPVGRVLRQYGHLVTGSDPEVGQALGDVVAAVSELRVGVALGPSYEFCRRPFREGGDGVFVDLGERVELRFHRLYFARPSASMCRAFSSSGTSSTYARRICFFPASGVV